MNKAYFAIGAITPLILSLFIVSNNWSRKDIPLAELGALPVWNQERVLPLDSVAKQSLISISGKSIARYSDGQKHRAIEWLAEALFDQPSARKRPVFRIQNSDIIALLDPSSAAVAKESTLLDKAIAYLPAHGDSRYFSFQELDPHIEEIQKHARMASRDDAASPSPFQSSMLKLDESIQLYLTISRSLQRPDAESFEDELAYLARLIPEGMEATTQRRAGQPYDTQAYELVRSMGFDYQKMERSACFHCIPPDSDNDTRWQSMGDVFKQIRDNKTAGRIAIAYARLGDAYRNHDRETFHEAASSIQKSLMESHRAISLKAQAEQALNYTQPLKAATWGYAALLALVLVAMRFWNEPIKQAAIGLACGSAAWHLIALVGAHATKGPLSSSSQIENGVIFASFAAVAISLSMTRILRIRAFLGLASVVALLLLAALSLQSKPLFEIGLVEPTGWLLAYSFSAKAATAASLVAGFAAAIYIGLALQGRHSNRARLASLYAACAAVTRLSFALAIVALAFGAAWADRALGDAWTWEAWLSSLLVCALWHGMLLSAQNSGTLREKGFMLAATFSNIVAGWAMLSGNLLSMLPRGTESLRLPDSAIWTALALHSALIVAGLLLGKSDKSATPENASP